MENNIVDKISEPSAVGDDVEFRKNVTIVVYRVRDIRDIKPIRTDIQNKTADKDRFPFPVLVPELFLYVLYHFDLYFSGRDKTREKPNRFSSRNLLSYL